MYNTTVCVGVSFGDEGKGKVIDYLAQAYDVVCRVQGGCNAGHSLVVNGKKTILRLIPSGILWTHTVCIMCHGMVIDPNVFHEEVTNLEAAGINLEDRLILSDRAHVILPCHIEADIAKNEKLGTTKKGIGPCYEAKINRSGYRVCDLVNSSCHNSFSSEVIATLSRFANNSTSRIINNYIKMNKGVIFEGAQGTLLDVDCGTYPYVTSSNAVAGGACTGAGVGPTAITSTIGITKAYVTRVGAGPFPTEANGDAATHIQTIGKEFGSVTGRPRQVGWLDLPLMRYAVDVNDLSMLAITKLDVLTGLDTIKVATHHILDNIAHEYPLIDRLYNVSLLWKEFPGWTEDITNVKSFEDLPRNAKNYISFIATELDIPICLISVGPERDQTIDLMAEASSMYFTNKFGRS
ncbi:MAG: adenylosuccinate synthetase [bacterium]|nr:adenylosuccinate synthetase [bacterium]